MNTLLNALLRETKLTICCVGAGYVGGPTMAVIAKNNPDIDVIVVDISQERIDAWNSDNLPIYEPGLDDIIKEVRNKNLFFTTDINKSIKKSEIIFISVNTPTKTYGIGNGYSSDISNLEKCVKNIALIAETNKIIIEKSTVPVKTAEHIKNILKTNKKNLHFEILSNPEFLAEGTAIDDLLNPNRILIGGDNTPSGIIAINKLKKIYNSWVDEDRITITNVWSSELSKLVANAFLAQRISSINSISALCEKTGADVNEISKVLSLDNRIGSKFLQPSIGFGGSCFKKDILNLVYICESYNLYEVAKYWKSVVDINDYQKQRFIKNIYQTMGNTLRQKQITIFGVAFKKDTSDVRESAAIDIIKSLLIENVNINIYDPKVTKEILFNEMDIHNIDNNREKYIKFINDPYKASANSDAILILTEWDEFKNYDYQKLYNKMNKPSYIFDGRNVMDINNLNNIGFNTSTIGYN